MRVTVYKSETCSAVVIGYSNGRYRTLPVRQAIQVAEVLDELYQHIEAIDERVDMTIAGTTREIVGDIADALRRAAKEAA